MLVLVCFCIAKEVIPMLMCKPSTEVPSPIYAFFLCLALLLVDSAGGVSAPESRSGTSTGSSAPACSSSLSCFTSTSSSFTGTPLLSACCNTFPTSLSTPFIAPQSLHRQRPTSSRLRAPGAACPFTSRHCPQISAIRFFAAASSSPRTTSKIRSYQAGCEAGAYCTTCPVGGAGRCWEGKALGAKDSFDSCDCGWGGARARRRTSIGFCGEGCRPGMLAVGGGAKPVRGPCCCCCCWK